MLSAAKLARSASTRGVGACSTHSPLSVYFLHRHWNGTMKMSTQTATVTSESTSPSAAGWMGRPATDANADVNADDSDIFPARTPADVDKEHFREGASVKFWSAWRFDDTPGGFKKLIDSIAPTIASPSDARYWAYHVFRSSWFLGQGAAGLLASSILTPGGGGGGGSPVLGDYAGLRAGVSAGTRLMAEAVQVYRQDLGHINAGTYKAPYDMDPRHRQFNPLYVADKTARFLLEASSTLTKNRSARSAAADPAAKEELTNVWMGGANIYPDYYLKTFHWQTDGWLSSKSAEVYEVSTETLFLGRQDAMQRTALVPLAAWFDEKTKKKSAAAAAAAATTSDAPADDAAPSVDGVVKADGEGARLLELACGTGRFLTFVRDNYPKMDVTGLDLSPFYLMEARKNSEYWEKLNSRRRQGADPDADADFQPGGAGSGAGGVGGGVGSMITRALSRVGGLAKAAGLPLPPLPRLPGVADSPTPRTNENEEGAREGERAHTRTRAHERGDSSARASRSLGKCELVHAKAESMPFPDEAFDAVTCVYLLHELPHAARLAAAAEVARVLKPGGVLVVADSIQLGDRPRLDPHLGRFGDFNEPHYRDYIASELVSVFGTGPGGAGLRPWTKELCSSTKVLSFRKPDRAAAA